MDTALTKSDKRLYDRELLRFTMPAVLEQFLTKVSTLAGAAFLGQIGAIELSASSLSTTLVSMTDALLTGLSIGITVMCARFLSDKKKLLEYASAGFASEMIIAFLLLVGMLFFSDGIISLLFSNAEPILKVYTAKYYSVCIFSIPFAAIDYTCSAFMRASGDSKTPFYVTLLANALNLIAIFVCLNMLGLDYTSAAYCYTGSYVLSAFVKYIIVISGKHKSFRLKFVRFGFSDIAAMSKIGLPAMFERFLIQFAFLGMQMVTTMLGTVVLAGYQAANNVISFVYTVTGGFEIAMVSLVGKYKYSDRSAATQMVKGSYKYACLFTFIVGVIMFIFSPVLVRIFAKEADVVKESAGILRLLVLTIPLTTAFQAGIGVLKTGTDIKYSLAINIISPNFIRIPIAFILVKSGLGFMGLYIGCVIDYLVRAVVVIWRILLRKWLET